MTVQLTITYIKKQRKRRFLSQLPYFIKTDGHVVSHPCFLTQHFKAITAFHFGSVRTLGHYAAYQHYSFKFPAGNNKTVTLRISDVGLSNIYCKILNIVQETAATPRVSERLEHSCYRLSENNPGGHAHTLYNKARNKEGLLCSVITFKRTLFVQATL